MIYFVQPVAGGPIKIGYSADVPTRVKQLEAAYRRPLAILGVIDGDREREREIHERFSCLRFGATEQFKPAAELMSFIGRPLLVTADPDAVEVMGNRSNATLPVRLEFPRADHARLDRLAKERGLSKAAYARQALLERMKADERSGA